MLGIHFEQGKIFLSPITFSNLREIKKSPVLVISNEVYNSTNDDIIVLAITSNTKERNHIINISNDSLTKGSLLKVSRIKADHVMKISKEIIEMELGMVKSEVQMLFQNLYPLSATKNNSFSELNF